MGRIYAVSEQTFPDAIGTPDGYDIVLAASDSDCMKAYRVDVTHGRCNCPAWTFQKKGGVRQPCKHLQRLGFKALVGYAEVKEPAKQVKYNEKVKVKA